jgi:excisionase family DNA binding protein
VARQKIRISKGITLMSTQEKKSELLKKGQLAKELNLSQRTIENFMRRGWLPFIRLGRSVRFDLADVLATVKARGQVNPILGVEVRHD